MTVSQTIEILMRYTLWIIIHKDNTLNLLNGWAFDTIEQLFDMKENNFNILSKRILKYVFESILVM